MGYYASVKGYAKIKDAKSCNELKGLLKKRVSKYGYNIWGLDYDIVEKDLYIDIRDSKKDYDEDDTIDFLDAITPFVEEGYLEYEGEDDCHWRFVLKDSKWVEENGTVAYGFENFTDKEMIEELVKRGYQVIKLPEQSENGEDITGEAPFDAEIYDDVRAAAKLIGLDPDAVTWPMDDEDIVRKANAMVKKLA